MNNLQEENTPMDKKFKLFTLITSMMVVVAITRIFATDNYADIDVMKYTEASSVTTEDNLIKLEKNGWVKYENVDFGQNGKERFAAKIYSNNELDATQIKVYIDSKESEEITTLNTKMFEDQLYSYQVVGGDLTSSISGIHDVYIYSESEIKLQWIKFTDIIEF